MRGFCGRNHSSLKRKEQGVGGVGGEGLKTLKKEVEEKGVKSSITVGGTEACWVQRSFYDIGWSDKKDVKVAVKKRTRKSTVCPTTARARMKSEVRSQKNKGNGSKEQEHKRRNGSGKEAT